MKKLATAIAAIALIGTPAFAADMAVKAPLPEPAPAAPTWTGFYVGIDAGWAWGSSNQNFTETPGVGGGDAESPLSFGSGNQTSAVGGFLGGYNWQVSPVWLIGVEGDYNWASLGTNVSGIVASGDHVQMNQSVDWLASARGRVGYVWGQALLYATGGAAWEGAEYSGRFAFGDGAPENTPNPISKTNSGWVAGGGVEYMATPHVLIRLEYLYYGLPSFSATAPCVGCVVAGPPTANYSWSSNNVQTVRAAVSYKF
jgi:outer membrane immunogenic protein